MTPVACSTCRDQSDKSCRTVELLVFPVAVKVKHLSLQICHGWHVHKYIYWGLGSRYFDSL